MVEAKNKVSSSHWWWFDSHNKGSSNRSAWLQSTLAELDEKTKTMLKLVEEDADSFAQRAEMYYKKRPELIGMVEDSYRTHRSLAERYDQIKSESGTRLLTQPWSSPLSFAKYRLDKSLSLSDKAYDSYSEAYGPEDSADESEVDDPEQEDETHQGETAYETDGISSGTNDDEVMRLREELERLKEENEAQKEEMARKDGEKREVIRQLSYAVDVLREENVKLRQCVAKNNSTPKKENRVEFGKLEEGFLGRLFGGMTKAQANIVPV